MLGLERNLRARREHQLHGGPLRVAPRCVFSIGRGGRPTRVCTSGPSGESAVLARVLEALRRRMRPSYEFEGMGAVTSDQLIVHWRDLQTTSDDDDAVTRRRCGLVHAVLLQTTAPMA